MVARRGKVKNSTHASARPRGQPSPGRTHARALGLSLCTPGATKISHIASQQQSTHAEPLSSTSDTRRSRLVVKARLECSAQACTIRGTERFVLSFHGHLCQARPDFIDIPRPGIQPETDSLVSILIVLGRRPRLRPIVAAAGPLGEAVEGSPLRLLPRAHGRTSSAGCLLGGV